MKPITDIFTLPKAHEAFPLPLIALKAVTARGSRTVFASSDTLYKSAVFGRDSLEVAEDLLDYKPRLCANILFTLASLQGTMENADNEESPGKIVHEYRSLTVDGKRIDRDSEEIFKRLAFKWGGNDHELAYYGSIDATPLFLRTLDRYCTRYGKDILQQTVVVHGSKERITMQEAANRSLFWLIEQLGQSRSGLLEYQRRNPQGILNQVWKDSEEFYVHADGQMANHNGPIASIEVQGLAYDALIAARNLDLCKKEACRELAENLRQRTIELLWLPKHNYFALGTDFDNGDDMRIIETETANPAALLDSGFFDSMPDADRHAYIAAIVRKIFGKDFLTNVGIRSRSLAAAHLIPFWDYHGSYVSWPKETYDIAKGLRRQGFPELAKQLENRLLNIVLKTRQYAEFFYIDDHGRVLTHAPRIHAHSELFIIDSTNKPETIQAWTVSAIFAITTKRINAKLQIRPIKHKVAPWQHELEKNIMRQIPLVERHLNPLMLHAKYPTYKYALRTRSSQ